jgi:hypothetical protein
VTPTDIPLFGSLLDRGEKKDLFCFFDLARAAARLVKKTHDGKQCAGDDDNPFSPSGAQKEYGHHHDGSG